MLKICRGSISLLLATFTFLIAAFVISTPFSHAQSAYETQNLDTARIVLHKDKSGRTNNMITVNVNGQRVVKHVIPPGGFVLQECQTQRCGMTVYVSEYPTGKHLGTSSLDEGKYNSLRSIVLDKPVGSVCFICDNGKLCYSQPWCPSFSEEEVD